VNATIAIDRTPRASVDASFIGLSYEKGHLSSGLFAGGDADLLALFARLGPSVLRIGGNSVDRTTWTPAGPGGVVAQVAKPDVEALAAFVHASKWKVIYGLDFAGSTAAIAADEASYAAGALGDDLFGFEIGNEPDLYSKNGDKPPTYTYADFTTAWSSFASAISSAVPSASFTGPASASDYTKWTIPFAKDEASSLRLLTQHWYRGDGKNPTSTIDLLLAPDPSLLTEIDALVAAAKADAIAGGVRFAETNSFYNGGAPGVSNGFGSALWVIDYAFTHAEHGSSGINLHGGGNGTGYTPIADTGATVVGPRAEYYGMLLFSMAMPGAVLDVKTTTTSTSVRVHAVVAPDGGTRVVIVNVDRVARIHATIDLGIAATHARSILLTAPSLDATTAFTLGGVTLGADGTGTPASVDVATSGRTVTIDVPTGSAMLLIADP
jgi:hypothetical protein